jgi:hypothetical protein
MPYLSTPYDTEDYARKIRAAAIIKLYNEAELGYDSALTALVHMGYSEREADDLLILKKSE